MPPRNLNICKGFNATVYYLTCTADERRVRKRTQNGNAIYTLGLKRKVGQGTRIEKEQCLRGSEYIALLAKESDPERETIRKLRHCFIHNRRCYELDEYLDRLAGLWILEVEVESVDAPVFLPPWAEGVEVTDDPLFSNYNLALRNNKCLPRLPELMPYEEQLQ
jgi:CYTH domain-containing protein